jgi:cellulose synthase (UDP-forming)
MPTDSDDPSTDAPRPTAPHANWLLIVGSVFFSGRYLYWRATSTLNTSNDAYLLISVLLFAAECYGFVSVLLFFLQTLDLSDREPAPLDEDRAPSVDVLVPIYNEPLEILQKTMIACRALEYPAAKLTLYVLDDGCREEVAALAARFGARYVPRRERTHAKAGNLNNALGHTRGEFLVLLDTDHIPVSSFLLETMGFFQKDPRLAFVQTPHHFYNPDCYQRNLVLESEVTHEQDLFFQVLQPGRDSVNAAIFAGSAAVFRRAALDDIGGFRTDCAIEDLHTSMELQSHGWHSVYYRRILSAGLSPEDFDGYMIQRMRWTRGGVQLFFLDNPLLKSGLGLRQRLCYIASLLYFFHAWGRIIYLLAPLSFLLLHCNPIVSDTWTLLWYFIPHYVVAHTAFQRISREYRSPFWSDVYETAGAFALAWASLLAMLIPEKTVFKVTPKGLSGGPSSDIPHTAVFPHVILLGLLVAGLIKLTYHFIDGGRMGADSYALSGAWAVFNFVLVACAIEVARQHPRRRKGIRLERSLPVVLRAGGEELPGRTLDLSEAGAHVELPERHKLPAPVFARIGEGDDTVVLAVDVRRSRWTKEGRTRLGLQFLEPSKHDQEKLVRLLFSRPDSWDKVRRPNRKSAHAIRDIAFSVLRKRLRRRGLVSGAAELIHSTGTLPLHVDELRADHAIVTWNNGVEPTGALVLRLPHRKRGHVDVRVEIGHVVGGAHDRHTFELHFLKPAKLNVAPVLDAMAAAAAK